MHNLCHLPTFGMAINVDALRESSRCEKHLFWTFELYSSAHAPLVRNISDSTTVLDIWESWWKVVCSSIDFSFYTTAMFFRIFAGDGWKFQCTVDSLLFKYSRCLCRLRRYEFCGISEMQSFFVKVRNSPAKQTSTCWLYVTELKLKCQWFNACLFVLVLSWSIFRSHDSCCVMRPYFRTSN